MNARMETGAISATTVEMEATSKRTAPGLPRVHIEGIEETEEGMATEGLQGAMTLETGEIGETMAGITLIEEMTLEEEE